DRRGECLRCVRLDRRPARYRLSILTWVRLRGLGGGPATSGGDRLADSLRAEHRPCSALPGGVLAAEQPPRDFAGQFLRAALDLPQCVGRSVVYLDAQSELGTRGEDLLLDGHT